MFLSLCQRYFVHCLDIEQIAIPKMKPFNGSHVSLNFEVAFKIQDFSQIIKVRISQTDYYRNRESILTEASIHHNDGVSYVNHQYLEKGKALLVKLNPCQSSKYLYITIFGVDSLIKSRLFFYKVDIQEAFKWETDRFICAVNNQTVYISPENFFIQYCAEKIDINIGGYWQTLEEGFNKIPYDKNAASANLLLTFTRGVQSYYLQQVKLLFCNDQFLNRRVVKTDDWICVVKNENLLRFYKRKWEDFEIKDVLYENKSLNFKSVTSVEEIPKSLQGNFTLEIEGLNEFVFKTTVHCVQLTYCVNPLESNSYKSKEENDNHVVIAISISGGLLLSVLTVIIIIIIYKRNVEKKVVMKDINPTYGDNEDYDGYYTETAITNENKYYQSEDYDENASEIRENNALYS